MAKLHAKGKNTKGEFVVIGFRDGNAVIQYSNKDVAVISSEFIDKFIIDDTAIEDTVTPTSQVYYKTLGWLAKTSFIKALIGVGHSERFNNCFKAVTGKAPFEKSTGYYPHANGVVKGGFEIAIVFPKHHCIELAGISIVDNSHDTKAICNNELGFKLFQLGFGLGRNHKISDILASIPECFRASFMEGYNKG